MTKQPLLTKLNLQFFADSAAEIAVEIQKEVKNLREMNERSLKEQETKFDGATQETKNAIDGANARIDGGDFSDVIGTTKAMTATATSNGATINGVPLTWTSSNPLVAAIDSDGNMELLAVGSATITCQIGINNLVKDTISVTVSDVKQDDYEVVYTPMISSIDEGTTQTFTVTLNKNNISTAEIFSFAIIGTVPATHYIFSIIDGNSFSIKNILEYYNSPLIIRCTSGSYSKDISNLS